MGRNAYRTKTSQRSHESLVSQFAQGLAEHWDRGVLHISCDTALARGVPESRLELTPMLAWDALIGDRQVVELKKNPVCRRYHRYLPFPPSVRDALDEWGLLKLKLVLHHQLLTGVVLYVDPTEIDQESLDSLDCSVVRGKLAMLASGQYWRSLIDVDYVRATEKRLFVIDTFERLWTASHSDNILKIYYYYPKTFTTKRYFPPDLIDFLLFLQNGRCPCMNACDLFSTNVDPTIDHIVNVKRGGTNVLINLQATCREYNCFRKNDRPEPRTDDYENVMKDSRWKPVIPNEYIKLLLTPQSDEDTLKKIRRFYGHFSKKELSLSLT